MNRVSIASPHIFLSSGMHSRGVFGCVSQYERIMDRYTLAVEDYDFRRHRWNYGITGVRSIVTRRPTNVYSSNAENASESAAVTAVTTVTTEAIVHTAGTEKKFLF